MFNPAVNGSCQSGNSPRYDLMKNKYQRASQYQHEQENAANVG